MDPLSITASAIAVCTALGASLKVLRSIQTIRNDVTNLLDDVSELHVVLRSVQRALTANSAHAPIPIEIMESLHSVLNRAKTRLEMLEAMIARELKRSEFTIAEPKINRLVWLRLRSKIIGCRQELATSKHSLTALLGSASLCGYLDLHHQLRDVKVLYQERIKRPTESEDLVDLSTGTQPTDDRLLETSESAAALTGSDSAGGAHIEETTVDANLLDGISSLLSEKLEVEATVSAKMIRNPRSESFSLKVQSTYYYKPRCDDWCSCVCHARYHLQSPRGADSFLGSLFLQFAGLPTWARKCNERRCRKQSLSLFNLSYYFPLWLWHRLFRMAIFYDERKGPQLALYLPRVRRDYDDVFRNVFHGDVSSIQFLFSSGLASPYDIRAISGTSLLHTMVDSGNIAAARFLLEQGADPHLENRYGETALDFAWQRILRDSGSTSESDEWRSMFDGEEYMEAQHFPPLHKIVLGLSDINLVQYLNQSTSGIDDQDNSGFTALSWAAGRGDVNVVNTLLHYRADPRVCSYNHETPLHIAALYADYKGTTTIVRSLLEAGADAGLKDCFGNTALLYAARTRETHPALKPLVDGGADPDICGQTGYTAMNLAALAGNTEVVEYLLYSGANPMIADESGKHTPMNVAVRGNHHEMFRALINNDLFPCTIAGNRELLHIAAAVGDQEMLRLLADLDFPLLLLDEEGSEGQTPQQIFDQRSDHDAPGLQEMWTRLCRKESALDEEILAGSDTSSDVSAVFEDACDQLD